MLYQEPKRNNKGQPICEICDVGYNKLLQHVNLSHGITAKEYKTLYNLHPRKGVQVNKLTSAMRKRVKANYNRVVLENLIVCGRNTRFDIGNTATNVEKVRIAQAKRKQEVKSKFNKERNDFVLHLAKRLRCKVRG